MVGPWSRRSLLASLGAITLAGCNTNTDPKATVEQPSTQESDLEPPASIDSAWPLPAYDAGFSNGTTEAAGPTESVDDLWQRTTGTGLSSPVVAHETLYVGGGNGDVLAVDARTGDERWRQSVATAAYTPSVMDDTLYVPTAEAIVALEATDGTKIWQTSTPNRDDIVRAGTVERAAVLVASHGVYWISATDDPSINPTIVKLALDDGSEQWRTTIQDPWTSWLFASDEAVVISTNHNGRVPWVLAGATGEILNKPQEPGFDFADERFYRAGMIYGVDEMFGIIEASGLNDIGYIWDQSLGYGEYLMSGDADRVYIKVNGGEKPGFYALSVTDGTLEWNTELPTDSVSRPIVAGETILINAAESIRCFDPSDGAELWSRPSNGIGEQIIIVDDLVYTTHDDTVRAFR